MNLKFYDLPKPETIRKHTVSVKASIATTAKWKIRNLEAGLTMNGDDRKVPFRPKPRRSH